MNESDEDYRLIERCMYAVRNIRDGELQCDANANPSSSKLLRTPHYVVLENVVVES